MNLVPRYRVNVTVGSVDGVDGRSREEPVDVGHTHLVAHRVSELVEDRLRSVGFDAVPKERPFRRRHRLSYVPRFAPWTDRQAISFRVGTQDRNRVVPVELATRRELRGYPHDVNQRRNSAIRDAHAHNPGISQPAIPASRHLGGRPRES